MKDWSKVQCRHCGKHGHGNVPFPVENMQTADLLQPARSSVTLLTKQHILQLRLRMAVTVVDSTLLELMQVAMADGSRTITTSVKMAGRMMLPQSLLVAVGKHCQLCDRIHTTRCGEDWRVRAL